MTVRCKGWGTPPAHREPRYKRGRNWVFLRKAPPPPYSDGMCPWCDKAMRRTLRRRSKLLMPASNTWAVYRVRRGKHTKLRVSPRMRRPYGASLAAVVQEDAEARMLFVYYHTAAFSKRTSLHFLKSVFPGYTVVFPKARLLEAEGDSDEMA